ncbi:(2Fe-2S)-binding protein [Catenovulum maritimum]|uniref:Bacterioferritin-associated ferredoxin n=1 Tax=Catenovulum maritimum TaxID=1513271 RepID=A0A0J8GRS2_9ALTE|nr:(2Fe-2S)-binding protein [Catenovulum maritimum]KMT65427.1 (2Fe-2S)-binding protein [Catenovulum maritimum]
MYVCLCNGVTDREIKKEVHNGCDSVAALQCKMAIANQCGRCSQHAKDIINETRIEKNSQLIASFA